MITKGPFVSEMGDGDRVRSVLLVSDRRLLTARNGKPYAKFRFMDRTGEIGGILWEDAHETLDGLEVGMIVGVRGVIESFNNVLQLKVEKVVRLEESEVDSALLRPTSRLDMGGMARELDELVASIKNPHLKQMLDQIFGREGLKQAFLKAPAAKGIHHSYIGGLLEHSLYIMKSIDALCPVYAHMGLSRDLLLSCAVLHDLGKVYEYTCENVVEMTAVGRLIGHVYLSAHIADEEIGRIEGFPDDLRLHVVHTLLAHHGELEFGSPKLPMTKEALFLHMLDDLDAKLAGFSAIIEATPDEDEFSAYASAYGRHLYARGIHQEE